VVGGALGRRNFPVSSLSASERLALSRIGGPGKAAQILEESRESKVSARNSTRSWVLAPNVRKNATLKESSQENSRPQSKVQWQAQTARLAREKMAQPPSLGEQWLL
jgi:hypothetical protein